MWLLLNASYIKLTPVCCSVLQCAAVCCGVLQCVAVCCRCCSVLQCAVCCSVLQCAAVCCSVLQCSSVCCSVLKCIAVCCSMLQCVAVCTFRREEQGIEGGTVIDAHRASIRRCHIGTCLTVPSISIKFGGTVIRARLREFGAIFAHGHENIQVGHLAFGPPFVSIWAFARVTTHRAYLRDLNHRKFREK